MAGKTSGRIRLPDHIFGSRRSRTSCLLIPLTSTFFCDDVAPEWMLTDDEGTSSAEDTNAITALLARPSRAGADTRHPIVLRHSLYPAGNASVFEPAVTSMAIRVPSRSSKRASAYPGMVARSQKEMLPDINAHGSPVAAAVLHLCFNPCRAYACRATGLSHGSYPDACQSISRGPMVALYRHHVSLFFAI
jgi:hypothetical protein